MQMVSQVMTRDVRTIAPEENLQRAAQMMDELNVGVLPVCSGERLVGLLTDRDIAVRAVAAGKMPDATPVNEVMSTDLCCVFEDQSMEDVMLQMADSQVRRIPVIAHDPQHRLVGIVSLGDIAVRSRGGGGQKENVEAVLETVSAPARPQGQSAAAGVAGRSGAGGPGAAASGAGTDMPAAGQTPRMAGAAGDDSEGRTGKTGQPRRNFGAGTEDLSGDGLPPH